MRSTRPRLSQILCNSYQGIKPMRDDQKEMLDFLKVAYAEAKKALKRAAQNLPPEDTRVRLHVKENQRIRKATDKKIARYWDNLSDYLKTQDQLTDAILREK